jgi:hypothetical protein
MLRRVGLESSITLHGETLQKTAILSFDIAIKALSTCSLPSDQQVFLQPFETTDIYIKIRELVCISLLTSEYVHVQHSHWEVLLLCWWYSRNKVAA